MQAMPDTQAARRGLGYLRKVQRPSGGFQLGGSGDVNSQSTAWAVQGMLAVGADPDRTSSGGKGALEYLAARQDGDGHYRYSASSDQTPVWVTAQALAATAGHSFPISPVARRAKPSIPGSAYPAFEPDSSTAPAPSSIPPSTSSDILKALGENGSTGSAGSGSSAGSASPDSSSSPSKSGTPAVPGTSPSTSVEGDAPDATPAAERSPLLEPFASGEGPGPSPWAPLGIGLLAGGLALGSVLLLGRRFGW
jgi:hypothetical protein